MTKSRHFENPDLISAGEFIGGGDNKSFYIPAYQRHFSWDRIMIDRLFEDIIDDIGHRMIPEVGDPDTDTVSFIGSILCYNSLTLEDISSQVRNQIPEGVLSIIDGQQRLTVLIISFIILHDYIRVGKSKLPEGWLKDKCIERMAELSKTFQTIRPIGKARVYPKMIRAFDDQWSTSEEGLDDKSPKYDSPLSHYSFCYGNFLQDAENEDVKFKYDLGSRIKDKTLKDNHRIFNNAHRLIKNHINKICENSSETFPQIENLIKNKDIMHALLNISDLSDISIEENTDYGLQCRLMRAILLSAYIMKKIYFVCLITKDESYAFDIFDSLNTTGELLTAYETFKILVIRKKELGIFQKSTSKKYLDVIEKYLNSFNVRQKQKGTADLLITFALAEDGTNLSKRLHFQRRYLIDNYNDSEGKENKELFIHHLMHVSEVRWLLKNGDYATIVSHLNISGNLISQEISQEIREACFCLRFLDAVNHTISLALITRFYGSVKIEQTDNELIESVKELCGAIKAIAAFFAIWRSSRETTDGIDNRHRDIMKDGINGVMKFNRIGGQSPNLRELQKSFCYLLKKDGGNSNKTINSVDAWVKNSQEIPIYRTAKAVAKFVLMTASHNTHPDQQNPGLITKVRNGIYESLISAEKWDSNEYETSEHIVPQSSASVGEDVSADSLDRIGNLTIIPMVANSILKARPWIERKAIYSFLSSENDDELEKAKKELPEDFPSASIEKLEKTRYSPMTKSISLKDDFSQDDIAKRGENILNNSWIVLSEWLNFNSD